MKKTNKNGRTLENEILVEWFIYVVESIAEDEKADERTTKKYIEKIKNYKGLDFFKVQALVNEFIKEIEKQNSVERLGVTLKTTP